MPLTPAVEAALTECQRDCLSAAGDESSRHLTSAHGIRAAFSRLRAALDTAQAETLERAAKVCERYGIDEAKQIHYVPETAEKKIVRESYFKVAQHHWKSRSGEELAAAIRALKKTNGPD